MKKLLALALAVVMMMAIALPAFAANGQATTHTWGVTDETPGASDTQSNFDNVVLEYGVAQAYEVTIPADINFGYMNPGDNVLSDTRKVSVSNAVIAGNETLVITVASDATGEKKAWTMADIYGKSTAVSYTATISGRTNAVFSETYDNNNTYGDDKVYTVMTVAAATGNIGTDPNNDAEVTITFATNGTAQEGLYRDTLTFTVSIIERYNSTFDNEVKVGPTAPATGD